MVARERWQESEVNKTEQRNGVQDLYTRVTVKIYHLSIGLTGSSPAVKVL